MGRFRLKETPEEKQTSLQERKLPKPSEEPKRAWASKAYTWGYKEDMLRRALKINEEWPMANLENSWGDPSELDLIKKN